MRQRHVRPLARPRPGRRARHRGRDVGAGAHGDRRLSRRGRGRRSTISRPTRSPQHLQPPLDALQRPAADRAQRQTTGRAPPRPADRDADREVPDRGSPPPSNGRAEWAAVDPAGQLAAILVEKHPGQLWPARNFDVTYAAKPVASIRRYRLYRLCGRPDQLARLSVRRLAAEATGPPHWDGDTSSSHRVRPDVAGAKGGAC